MADPILPRLAADPDMQRAKDWWHNHGRAIVGGVALGLAAVVGYNYWQNHQDTRAEKASQLFAQLQSSVQEVEVPVVDAEPEEASEEEAAAVDSEGESAAEEEAAVADSEGEGAAEEEAAADAEGEDVAEEESTADSEGEDATEEESTADTEGEDATEEEVAAASEGEDATEEETANAEGEDDDAAENADDTDDTEPEIPTETTTTIDRIVAAELMNTYRTSPYAVLAAFTLAKVAVVNDELADAADSLRWAMDNAEDDSLRHIARLRLAAVLLSQGEAAQVSALLAVDDEGAFAARYHELRGDTHAYRGDIASARTAYQSARATLPSGSAADTSLTLKLDNLR